MPGPGAGWEREDPPEGGAGQDDPTEEHLSFVEKVIGDKEADPGEGAGDPGDEEGEPGPG